MSNSELEIRRTKALARGVGVLTQNFAARAKNAEVWDEDGKRLIDFASGIAVLNTGHGHPRIVAAIKNQLDLFTHTCHQVLPYAPYVELAERLNALTPGDFEKKSLFVSTGAEAVENAIKIARAYTKRTAVIAFAGGFHGRTFMGMSLTGKMVPYKVGFGSMVPEVFHVPFPYELHGISIADSLNAIQKLFKSDVNPERVAAIIFEPVQGEGGFVPAPKEFVTEVRALCDKHGIVMIADEIQTGFARTGTMFAMDAYETAPDIITMAKSLAGGVPLAAVCGRAEIMDAAQPGGLGGTYGGNPLGIAAAHAVLDVIKEEGLCERAAALGEKLRGHLTNLQRDIPEIAEVRGPGFMVAVEFNNQDGTPAAEMTNAIRVEALKRGLLLLTCGIYGNVVRFLAPITIEDAVFEEAVGILEASIRAVAGK